MVRVEGGTRNAWLPFGEMAAAARCNDAMRFRPLHTAWHSDDSHESLRWGRIRFVLGMTQMAAAVVAVVFLFTEGVTAMSLTAVVIASSLTSVSVLLFGSRRRHRRDRA